MTDREDNLSDKIYLYHGFRRISDVPQIDNGSIAYKGEGAGGGKARGFTFSSIKKRHSLIWRNITIVARI